MSEDKVKLETKTEVKQESKPVGRAIDKYKGEYLFRPIKKTWLANIDPKHDGATVFDRAVHLVSPQRDKNTGLVITGMTDQEARELEQDMGLKPQELSPYNFNFWADFRKHVRVPKEGIKLNLDRSALEKMQFLYLKASQNVAPSYADAENNPFAEYVLTNMETESKIHANELNVKMDAFIRLKKMTFEEQFNFLAVYEEGRFKVSKGSSPDLIHSTIGKIVDREPQKFLDLIDNSNYKEMILLADCLQAGLVKKQGTNYYILGGDKLGFTYLDAINNLQKPEYNEVKISLLAKLEASKK